MLLYSNNPGTSEYYKLIIRNITSLIYLLLISHLSNAKPVWNKDQRNVKSNLILNMKPNKLSENKSNTASRKKKRILKIICLGHTES